ncbi:helix-turn-helix transcriptional regulator [Streptomyces lomondensis]|nr:helix-turn-helix transcriptional regulator [Streptomyces lomondensis]
MTWVSAASWTLKDFGGYAMARRRQRLAQRRQAMGLTQEGLAEHLGVDRSTVVRWEAGTASPRPWMRPRLAETLGVSVTELVELLKRETAPAHGIPALHEPMPSGSAHVDLASVAELRREYDELAASYDRAPSASLLAKGGEQLSLITLRHGRARVGERRESYSPSVLMCSHSWDNSSGTPHRGGTTSQHVASTTRASWSPGACEITPSKDARS